MKPDIHPSTSRPGHLHLRHHVHHPQHREERRHPRRRLLAVPPVLHRQAEDPRHRWPRGPVREALRQERHVAPLDAGARPASERSASPASSSFVACPSADEGSADDVFDTVRRAARRVRRAREASSPTRRCTRTRAGPPARPPLRRARPDRRAATARWTQRRRRPRGGARARRRGRRPSTPRSLRSSTRASELEEQLRHLLLPRDPNDDKDVILEVKAGEGGEESALFAGDLLRMYLRYAERRGWKTEVLDATESDLGGYKDVTVAVKATGTPSPATASGRG